MLVFPQCFLGWGEGGKKMRVKWANKKFRCLLCTSVQHELLLSRINMSLLMSLCLEQGFACCKLMSPWVQSWCFMCRYPTAEGFCRACHRMSESILVEICFMERPDAPYAETLLWGELSDISQACCTVESYFLV